MIPHEIFRVVSRSIRYISCYITENQFSLGRQQPRAECGRLDHCVTIAILAQVVHVCPNFSLKH